MKFNVKNIVSSAALAALIFSATNADAAKVSVKRGDTLSHFASTYNVTVSDIKRTNNLKSDLIFVGQTLQIPTNTVTASNSASSSNKTAVHTVKRGDTLWGIGRKYGISVSSLKSINQLTTNTIYVGQKISLKNSSSSTSPKTQTTKEKATSSYIVKRGDSLWKISKQYGVSVSQLKSWNDLKSNTIYVNQKLSISKASPVPNEQKSTEKETAPSNSVDQLISEAKKYIGVPYKWAGSSPSTGFDCSGYLNYVFNNVGVSIPRTVASIWSVGTKVSSPQVGDVVFFETYKPGPSHAGIYLGNNKFIHSGSNNGVTISDMTTSYYKQRYLGAKRYM